MYKSVIAAALLAASASVAVPVVANAAPRTNWNNVTCNAFAAFESHPSVARSETVMADSLHVAWKYLGGDIWNMYGDYRADGTSGKYFAKDMLYVRDDCQGAN